MASMVRHEEEQLTVDERKILTGRLSETHVLELYAHLRSFVVVLCLDDILSLCLMYPFFIAIPFLVLNMLLLQGFKPYTYTTSRRIQIDRRHCTKIEQYSTHSYGGIRRRRLCS